MSSVRQVGQHGLVLGTRGSALARAQTSEVLDRLHRAEPGMLADVHIVTTHGDRDRTAPLSSIGGTGVFAKELQRALLDGSIDVAVHSLKDLPPAPVAGLVLAAVPPRADARDALVSCDGLPLRQLPAGARVGTGSARRAACLRALRSDVEVVEIRGNVDTRIGKVRSGDLDAAVLAVAGLARLGRLAEAAEVFEPDAFLPAPGQGALGLEIREDHHAARALLARIDDPDAHDCAVAERAFLARLGAGCTLPVGAYATVRGDTIVLRGMIAAVAGPLFTRSLSGPRTDPGALGARLAAQLLDELERRGR